MAWTVETVVKKMGIYRWKLKDLGRAVVFFVILCLVSLNYLNKKSSRSNEIYKALGSRKVVNLVQPFEETFLINVWHRSGPLVPVEGDNEIFLVIAVTSSPENDHRRNIIRSSWMKMIPTRQIIMVFFTGRPKSGDMTKLQLESNIYGDIIVDDFDENYYALAGKSLRILKWFYQSKPEAKFLIKTDDDVFININNLIKHLEFKATQIWSQQHSTALNYMGGVVFSGRAPHTFNVWSKWYVPPDLWELQKHEIEAITKGPYKQSGYPDYLEGNFYVISGHTVPLLLNTSVQLPLFHLEDVYLSGFVASEILNIKLQTVPSIFTDSAAWPWFNYRYQKIFVNPQNIIAYHCDNSVEIIQTLYEDS